jgi:hypothetical protein
MGAVQGFDVRTDHPLIIQGSGRSQGRSLTMCVCVCVCVCVCSYINVCGAAWLVTWDLDIALRFTSGGPRG